MGIYHVRLSFATAEHGWVEQFYRRDVSFQAALAAGVDLAIRRYSILGAGVTLYRVRVTQPGQPRAVATQDVSGVNLPVPIASAYDGAEIRLVAGPGFRNFRSYFLRGLPRGALLNPQGASRWGAIVQVAAERWITSLADGKWCEQCRGYVGEQLPITNLVGILDPSTQPLEEGGGPIGPSIYATAAMATVEGQLVVPDQVPEVGGPVMVRISRAKWDDLGAVAETPINGEFPIIAPVQGTLQYFGFCPFVGSYAGGGTLQISQPVYLPITSATLTRGGNRKCGPVAPGARLPGQPLAESRALFSGFDGALRVVLSPIQAARQLAAEITPTRSTPPQYPFPVNPPFPEPITGTLTNLKEVLTYLIAKMGHSGSGVNYTPIGIAPILNMVDTWWIGLTGVFVTEYSDTGVLAAVSAGMAILNKYAQVVKGVIDTHIPPTAKLILQGHSLGGITCENLHSIARLIPRIVTITTFGSPVSSVLFRPRPMLRFKVATDLVPIMTPLGLASDLFNAVNYNVVPVDPLFKDFPGCHTRMDHNPGLLAWDNWGLEPDGNPPFVLGDLQRFRVPF